MKVLIITYYWPPAGGSGVQRWLKFVKYFQEFNIQPIIYTVENANYQKLDESLVNEIPKNVKTLKQTIWEPTDLLFWKKKEDFSKSVSNATKNSFLSWIRGNFFIPDPKIFWVKKSVKYLNKYISENSINTVISTGPPHSMHLIAQKLKENNKLRWIADFRDPWSNLYYNQDFKQSNFAKRKNKKLEVSVLKDADVVVTVSTSLKKELSEIAENVKVITNGFDDEVLLEEKAVNDKKFTISYIGLLPKQSNPKIFFKALKSLCDENVSFSKNLHLNFVGDISDEVKKEIDAFELRNNTSFRGYVSHKEAIQYQKNAQVLLLLIPNVAKSEGILTGKLFEYLAANRPILAIGPKDGDLAEILTKTNTGTVVGFDDEDKMKKEILNLYNRFKKESLTIEANNINQYHRRELTKKMAEIIKEHTL